VSELIDVLNSDGSPAGIRKPKADVHRDGDWHRSVHVWIFTPDGRVLLQKRSLRKENNPGLWDVSAAGHVSAGEDWMTSAIREVEEELGLRLSTAEIRHAATFRESAVMNDGTWIENEFHEVYVVKREIDFTSLVLQDGEVEAVELIPLDQLPKWMPAMVPHDEEYAFILTIPTTSSP
jgi:isopentenyldiphosphate isomerase